MVAIALITVGCISAVLVWCFGVRRHLTRQRRPIAGGPFLQLAPWADWRACAGLARAGDKRAAVFSRIFLASLAVVVTGVILSFILR